MNFTGHPQAITLTEPLVIDSQHGTRYQGVGKSHYASWMRSGWHGCSKPTRIVYNGPAGTPAVVLRRTLGLYFADFTIERETPGPCIQLEAVKDWGNGHHVFERVAFLGRGTDVIGVRCGEKASDHNCADLTFRNCYGRGLSALLQVENEQGVNYVLDACDAFDCAALARFNRGGQVQVRGGGTYNVPTVIEAFGGGVNACGVLIDGLRCDRNKPGQTLIDASRAVGSICATVIGVGVVAGKGGPLFIPPVDHMAEDWRWSLETVGVSGGGHDWWVS